MALPSIPITPATALQLGAVTAIGIATVASGGTLAPLLRVVLAPVAAEVVGKAVEGLIPNILSGLFTDKVKEAQAKADKARRSKQNHDVQRAINTAIAKCVADAADKYSMSIGGKEYLKSIAAAMTEKPLSLELTPGTDAIDEANVMAILTSDATTIRDRKPLKAKQWEVLIGQYAFALGQDTKQVALQHAAGHLEGHFSAVLVQVLKDAGAESDPAWFAVVLRFLGEIHADVKETNADVKETKADVKAIKADTHAQAVNMRAFTAAFNAHQRDVREAFEKLTTACTQRAGTLAKKDIAADREHLAFIHEQIEALSVDVPEMKTSLAGIDTTLRSMDTRLEALAADTKRNADSSERIEKKLDGRLRPHSPPSTVPALNATIVPRPAITNEIHKALAAKDATGAIKQAATTAHGGFGKTVAALLYAHQHADFYTGGRFFLSMENADFAVQLASIADAMKLTVPNYPTDAAKLVKAEIERAANADGTPAPTLLILDNITGETQWKAILTSGLLPRGACRVLITTRAEGLTKATPIKVGPLTNEQARAVYAKFCEGVRAGPDDATADAITDWLKGLAVAVAAVAARMRLVPHDSWANYATTLPGLRVGEFADKSERVRAELGYSDQPLPEDRRTARVIDDAYNALALHEQRAVQYAALLPEDMAPKVWLETLVTTDAARAATKDDGSPDPLALTIVADDLDPADPGVRAVAHLLTLDVFSTADESGNLLTLHRLWHARVRERAAAEKQDPAPLWSAIAACAKSRRAVVVGTDAVGNDRGLNDPAALTDASLRWELTPLASMCGSLWERPNLCDATELAHWIAAVARQCGRYSEAEYCVSPIMFNENAALRDGQSGDVIACFCNLATVQHAQGKFSEAIANIERSIRLTQPDHSGKDLDDRGKFTNAAVQYSNYAAMLRDAGMFERALVPMRTALALVRECQGEESVWEGSMLSEYAQLQQDLGDLSAARASMERAIDINLKHFAPDHPNMAISYNNLAHIAVAEGSIPEAVALYRRSYPIWLKALGRDHTRTKHVAAMLRRYDPPGP